MKKLIWILMLVSVATFATIKIDVDQLRSPDHTKVWTPPSATTTLIGTDTSNALTNKTLDKLVLTTSQVDTTTTGANAVFPTPTSTMFNFSNASLTSVDGITAPANVFVIIFRNKTGSTVTINNETGVNTTFRIVTGTGAAITLATDASLVLSYSTNYSRWYVTGGSGSGGGGLSAWITAHAYLAGDIAIESNKIYNCLTPHTSGTFATDLAGGNWVELSAMTGVDLTSNQTVAGTKTFSSTIAGSVNGNAATVTTNANLTGPITSSGNTTSVASQTGTGSTFVMSAAPTITGHPVIEGVTSTGATGTGKFVFDTSPTLVTPVLGVATATSVNGTSIPSSATLATTALNLGNFGATTSAQLAGVISDETGSGALVFGTAPQFTTSVAIGGSPNANAVLDVQSTTKAFMPPRMTTAQKLAIASPTAGMVVYDSTLNAQSTYDGTYWQTGLGTISTYDSYTVRLEGASARGTGSDTFITKFDTQTITPSDGMTIVNSASLGTTITITKAGLLSVMANTYTPSSALETYITKNQATRTGSPIAAEIMQAFYNGTGATAGPVTATFPVVVGDVIRISNSFTPTARFNNFLQATLVVTSSSSTYSIASANYSRRAYTPTFTGFGTVTAVNCNESRSGEYNEIDCSFTSGTVSGVEARVSLPNMPASNFASLAKCGDYSENQVFGYISAGVLCEPSTQYVTFARQDAATAGFTKALGTKFYSSVKYSFTARIPISGWSNVSQSVAPVKNYNSTPGVDDPKFYSYAVSATGVVTQDIGDLINGNCSISDTSLFTCTLNSGKITTAINCVPGGNITGNGLGVSIQAANSTSVIHRTFTTSTAAVNAQPAYILCHGY